MTLYRDHRSTLEESMETVKVFESEDEMLEYLRNKVLRDYGLAMFSRVLNVEITIGPEEYTDDRIGWDRCHYVCSPKSGCSAGERGVYTAF
jgi:hypothetical protein